MLPPIGYNEAVRKNKEEFIMKTKNILKGISLSIGSLIAGFVALALPFRIFDFLSADGVRMLFVAELTVYFVVGMVFLAIKDKNDQKKKKQRQQHYERQQKINRVIDEWYNIAA